MRAVVFSGTTEGRIFSRQLAQLGADVLVSVATPLGSEEQGSFAGIMVHCGRLTPDEMAALVQGADLCASSRLLTSLFQNKSHKFHVRLPQSSDSRLENDNHSSTSYDHSS